MRALLPILLVPAFFATACSDPGNRQPVQIENAVVTLPAVRGRPGAAYFSVTSANAGLRLSGLSSPRVERIELHESMADGMGPLKGANLTPGEPLKFEPGGRHAMLFGVDPALKVGDKAALTFTFAGAPAMTVQAEVRGPGGGSVAH